MIYTITSTLPEQHGGRTKSLLSRIRLLQDELGVQSTILTTNYNIDYPDIYEVFREKNTAHENTEFENIYDWLSGHKLFHVKRTLIKNKPKITESEVEIEGLTAEHIDEDTVRYYRGDEYTLYRKFHEGSRVLKFEDFMSPISRKRVKRKSYNKYGDLHQIIWFDPKIFHKISEEFYDVHENLYCTKHYTVKDDKPHLSLIELLDDGRPYKFFADEKRLFQYYFEERFSKGDIVFNDARLLDRPLLSNGSGTKNILVFHSSHLADTGKGIRGSYGYALKNSDKVASYLVLTHHQKEDIQKVKDIPDEKFSVIPHFITPSRTDRKEIKEQFVYIGRFGVQKQLDHLIRAFKIFKDAGYEERLVLYGMDEANQLAALKKLIAELELTDQVDIHGFTNNPKKVFAESKASLLTSKLEGFGLTVMESIDAGCPVISYDVEYGPREIIDEGKTGYLVEPQNIEAFAEAMMKVSDEGLKTVSISDRLHKETAVENYRRLLEQLEN